MIIIEDFIVNLAAGFTQTLLQHIAKRALRSSAARLRQAYQSGFELMLRSAGSGLSKAELGQVSDLFQAYLGQSEVADAFLDMALKNLGADVDWLVSLFYKVNMPDGLVNISFDLNRGLLAFKEGLVYSDPKGVHVSSDQGRTWRNCFPEWRMSGSAPWFHAIDKERIGTIVAACENEAILVTDDWGQTWAEIGGPPTGDKPHPGLVRPLVSTIPKYLRFGTPILGHGK